MLPLPPPPTPPHPVVLVVVVVVVDDDDDDNDDVVSCQYGSALLRLEMEQSPNREIQYTE
jgi:hypothetical protein